MSSKGTIMRNWLRQKLIKFLRDDHQKEPQAEGIKLGYLRTHHGLDEDANDPIRFTLYNAVGGKILEMRTHDKRTDRWNTSLYIIESNENFGESLGRIVFTEMLKKG